MELTIGNIIKLILGIVVIVVVIYGVYAFFKGNIIDFFKNWGSDSGKIILGLIK